MKIEEIIAAWKSDTKLDDLNLDMESTKIPNLHSKYLTMLSDERILLRSLGFEKKKIYKKLRAYYSGEFTEEELKESGREQFRKKVIRSEMDDYVYSDDEMIRIEAKIEMQQEKVDVLTEVIKSINNRGFQIKNAIDWRRLTMGGP
jgi:hypothetical protein